MQETRTAIEDCIKWLQFPMKARSEIVAPSAVAHALRLDWSHGAASMARRLANRNLQSVSAASTFWVCGNCTAMSTPQTQPLPAWANLIASATAACTAEVRPLIVCRRSFYFTVDNKSHDGVTVAEDMLWSCCIAWPSQGWQRTVHVSDCHRGVQ